MNAWKVRVVSKSGRLVHESFFSREEYAREYVARGIWSRYEVEVREVVR